MSRAKYNINDWFSKENKLRILRELPPNQVADYIREEQTTFEITMQYVGKVGYDNLNIIEIEGVTNAVAIFESYRAIGHNLGLRSIVVKSLRNDQRIKKVNFKYNDNRQK